MDFDFDSIDYENRKEVKKQLKQTESFKQRALDQGIDEALLEPRENLFMRFLNFIDKPKQITQGLIDSAFIRKDLSSLTPDGIFSDIKAAADRALEERQNGFDLLRRAGVKSPVARTLGGLAIELTTDPLVLLGGAAKNAATWGGVKLSNVGAKKALSKLNTLLPAYDNSVLQAGGRVNEALKNFKRATSITDDLNFLNSKNSLSYFQQVRKRALEKELTIIKPTFETLFHPTKDLDIFADKGLAARLEIPFLGNIFGKARKAEEVSNGKLGLVSKIFNPLKLEKELLTINPNNGIKIFGKNFSKKTKPQWMYEIDLSVKDSLNNLSEVLKSTKAKVDTLPGVGVISKAGTEIFEGADKALSVLKDGLKRSFARKFVVGDLTDNTLKEFNSTKAGLRAKSLHKLTEIFPEALDEGSSEIFKRASLAIDNGNIDFIKNHITNSFNKTLTTESAREIEKALKKYIDGDDLAQIELDDLLQEIFHSSSGGRQAFEAIAEQNRNHILKTADPDLAPIIKRTFKAFDDIFEKEVNYGIRSKKASFFSAYIPHAYKNIDKFKRTNTKFKRKYLSLSEAFEKGGYLPETDLRKLFESRYYSSELAIAQKRYLNRAVLESSIPIKTYRNLVLESIDDSDPIGRDAARKILSDRDLPLPTSIRDVDAPFDNNNTLFFDLVDEATKDLAGGELKKIKDPSTRLKVIKSLSRTDNEFRQILRKSGYKPLDSEFPIGLNGEIAKVVSVGRQKRILPVGIANAIEETIYQKDLVKAALKDSPALSSMVDMIDSSVSHMKLLTTQPWPAYWAQNIFTDRLFDVMDKGIDGIDPGQWVHTLKLLDGKADIITKQGTTISSRDFKQIIREAGIEYSVADMIEVAKGFSATDIEKMAKINKGNAIKNLAKGDVKIAVEQAGNYMRKNFENFFRVNSLVHHLKRGSGVGDAVRLSQEALLDYRQLTPFEQSVARRFYMFYGWISKSTKKTLKSYFLSPGDLQVQLASAKSIQELFSSPDALPTLEEYDSRLLDSMLSSEQISVSLGENEEGKKLSGRIRGLPLNTLLENFSIQAPRVYTAREIIDTFSDSAQRTLQKQFSAANPFIKTPVEFLTNKNLYFNRDLDSKFLRRIPSIEAAANKIGVFPFNKIPSDVYQGIDNVAKDFFNATPDGEGFMIVEPGLLWTAVNFYPPLTRLLSTVSGFSNENIPLAQTALKTLTGVKVDDNNLEQSMISDNLESLRKLFKEQNIKLKEDNAKNAPLDF